MKIVLGSDHAGFNLKERVKSFLEALNVRWLDVGTGSTASVDYPDYAEIAARKITSGEADLGILACGTGIGVCIAANKIRGIRAVTPWTPEIARLTREHNNSNVLCLSGRYISQELSLEIAKSWLTAAFERGGRHERRVRKILGLEERF